MPFLRRGSRRHHFDKPAIGEEPRWPASLTEPLPLVLWDPGLDQGPKPIGTRFHFLLSHYNEIIVHATFGEKACRHGLFVH